MSKECVPCMRFKLHSSYIHTIPWPVKRDKMSYLRNDKLKNVGITGISVITTTIITNAWNVWESMPGDQTCKLPFEMPGMSNKYMEDLQSR